MFTTPTKDEDLEALHAEFTRTEWEGCFNLDCLPGCTGYNCVRYAEAFERWAARSRRSK